MLGLGTLIKLTVSGTLGLGDALLTMLRFWLLVILAAKSAGVTFVPSQKVDLFLHRLLDGKSSIQTWVGTLEHRPGLGTRGEIDRQKWLAKFQQTHQRFKQSFGMTFGSDLPASCEILIKN